MKGAQSKEKGPRGNRLSGGNAKEAQQEGPFRGGKEEKASLAEGVRKMKAVQGR